MNAVLITTVAAVALAVTVVLPLALLLLIPQLKVEMALWW